MAIFGGVFAYIQAEPGAVSLGPNRLDVFAWGTEQSLLHKSFDVLKQEWSPREGFDILGRSIGGPPKAVSDGIGSLQVVSFSKFGNVQLISFDQTTGKSSRQANFEDLGTLP
ncbi:hypothetical protein BDZ45DRAFT_743644 [Acephala macrosclerotiorum]|nr:hypothetical protein BDZ45DRAFT_743644 [Acephala macrosclerotiorum]